MKTKKIKINLVSLLLILIMVLFVAGCSSSNNEEINSQKNQELDLNIESRPVEARCKEYGEVVYDGKKQINSEQEARGLFLEYRPKAKPQHIIYKEENNTGEVYSSALINGSSYNWIGIMGWLLVPYSIVENNNFISGILISKDGKIYSFKRCDK